MIKFNELKVGDVFCTEIVYFSVHSDKLGESEKLLTSHPEDIITIIDTNSIMNYFSFKVLIKNVIGFIFCGVNQFLEVKELFYKLNEF